jgi:hypothetical protein
MLYNIDRSIKFSHLTPLKQSYLNASHNFIQNWQQVVFSH